MDVDERRRNEVAGGIEHLARVSLDRRADRNDPARANGDVLRGAAVRQGGVAHDQVVSHGRSTRGREVTAAL
jgi:hypothetical protein